MSNTELERSRRELAGGAIDEGAFDRGAGFAGAGSTTP
jgi:hypothetical protein